MVFTGGELLHVAVFLSWLTGASCQEMHLPSFLKVVEGPQSHIDTLESADDLQDWDASYPHHKIITVPDRSGDKNLVMNLYCRVSPLYGSSALISVRFCFGRPTFGQPDTSKRVKYKCETLKPGRTKATMALPGKNTAEVTLWFDTHHGGTVNLVAPSELDASFIFNCTVKNYITAMDSNRVILYDFRNTHSKFSKNPEHPFPTSNLNIQTHYKTSLSFSQETESLPSRFIGNQVRWFLCNETDGDMECDDENVIPIQNIPKSNLYALFTTDVKGDLHVQCDKSCLKLYQGVRLFFYIFTKKNTVWTKPFKFTEHPDKRYTMTGGQAMDEIERTYYFTPSSRIIWFTTCSMNNNYATTGQRLWKFRNDQGAKQEVISGQSFDSNMQTSNEYLIYDYRVVDRTEQVVGTYSYHLRSAEGKIYNDVKCKRTIYFYPAPYANTMVKRNIVFGRPNNAEVDCSGFQTTGKEVRILMHFNGIPFREQNDMYTVKTSIPTTNAYIDTLDYNIYYSAGSYRRSYRHKARRVFLRQGFYTTNSTFKSSTMLFTCNAYYEKPWLDFGHVVGHSLQLFEPPLRMIPGSRPMDFSCGASCDSNKRHIIHCNFFKMEDYYEMGLRLKFTWKVGNTDFDTLQEYRHLFDYGFLRSSLTLLPHMSATFVKIVNGNHITCAFELAIGVTDASLASKVPKEFLVTPRMNYHIPDTAAVRSSKWLVKVNLNAYLP